MKLPFFCQCVNWPEDLLPALDRLVEEGEDIERQEFLDHVNKREQKRLERNLGYDRHLTMAGDYHVRYYRAATPRGPIYYLKWSAIEYVYATPDQIESINGSPD